MPTKQFSKGCWAEESWLSGHLCKSIDEKASRKDNGKHTSARPPEGLCVGPVLALRAQGVGERWAVSRQVENWNGLEEQLHCLLISKWKGDVGAIWHRNWEVRLFLNQSRKMFRELELDLPNLSEAWQSLLEKWTAVGWGWTAVRETCLGSLLGHHMKAGTLRGTPAGFTLEQAEGTKLV